MTRFGISSQCNARERLSEGLAKKFSCLSSCFFSSPCICCVSSRQRPLLSFASAVYVLLGSHRQANKHSLLWDLNELLGIGRQAGSFFTGTTRMSIGRLFWLFSFWIFCPRSFVYALGHVYEQRAVMKREILKSLALGPFAKASRSLPECV